MAILLAACSQGAPSTPAPTPGATATAEEAVLLAGLRLDLTGRCEPARTDLPDGAIGALDCHPLDVPIQRARIILFARDADLMTAYVATIKAHDVPLRTGTFDQRTSEGSYMPGDDPAVPPALTRLAHWFDAQGDPRFLTTVLPYVLVQVDATAGTPSDLYNWVWKGNMDVPGGPTIWRANGPADPNAKG